ncbi:acyltransferase family protein [Alteraurantiacibacter aquimixticola]|uniref:Acyltransferase 3 domain-containing protein n=1 Tax=Alteraurantiacibacter aquimixticola TaxID=2489173 RepID=A0A4T3F1Z2_9SPHN|nr:acyltransferase family protein [Alteraurantiacibacter aquimixticola]TIX51243.1 hypothetical protein E5222_01870 [Alteraurantiacibacter aquimixticola]
MQHPEALEHPASKAALTNATSSKGDRIAWLDIARGSSILLVVLFHASIAAQLVTDIDSTYWLVNDVFAYIRMPLFFAISGMLSARVLSRDWPILLEKRVILLGYLYVLWATIGFLRSLALGADKAFSSWVALVAWPNAVLWFIWALAIYFVVAKLCQGRFQNAALVLSFGLSILVTIDALPVRSVEHAKALNYAFYFLFGAYSGPLILGVAKHWGATLIVASAAYVALFLALRWGYAPQRVTAVMSLIGLAAGLAGSISLSYIPMVKSVLAFFGRNTLTIYVAHTQLLGLFVPLGADADSLPGFAIWGAIAMGAAAIGLSLLLRPLLETIGARWFYALPGRFVDWWRTRTQPRMLAYSASDARDNPSTGRSR